MSSTANAFWKHYENVVGELFPRLTPQDGLDPTAVAEAEARLGHPIPALLRELYLRSGAREDLHQSHEQVLGPDALDIEEGYLVLAEENHGACYWGIALKSLLEPDPPVDRCDSTDPPQWTRDHARLSDFLVTLARWQAVNGGAPLGGNATADRALLDRLATWSELESPGEGWRGVRLFGRTGQIVCVINGSELMVLAAARDAESFRALDASLGLTWSYTWPED